IPRKMRVAALRSVLSRKLKDGEILFVDTISFDAPKAKEAKSILVALSRVKGFERLSKKSNAALIALSTNDANVKKSFGNFGNIEIEEARNMNVVDILSSALLIIENPDESLKTLEAKLVKSS
ncbi:MAG TPA: 50S ribosomal protein L4, partial [Candidatus Paceibacterota bacterium]|nr:50S ribosomal protein L4 [Candidatus Paceibacterota bacterium]